jgi:hypothetical protein
MSKRPFEGDEGDRRVRARVELEEEVADLPLEIAQVILEEGGVRPLMRFARASKQSEEVAARAFVAVFKRDIMWAVDPTSRSLYSHWYSLSKYGMPQRNGSWSLYMRQLARIYDDIISHIGDEMGRSIKFLYPDPTSRDYNPRAKEEEMQLLLGERPILSIFSRHSAKMHEFVFRLVPHVESEAIDEALARFETSARLIDSSASSRQFTGMIHWAQTDAIFRALFVNLLLGFSPRLELHVPKVASSPAYTVSLATHGAHRYEDA